MTSELNFDHERAALAHRAAFALITTVLSQGADVRATLRSFVDIPAEPTEGDLLGMLRELGDIVEVLTWHAAGNLLAATGSPDAALATIRAAAIDQEIFLRDERGETGD
ncbi:hypothetical protein [Agromyces sp. CCNWLW203]|uniref:hypothetical protein n=1 Tax=Agromyces sp. CCNWLW203 TaxID=3112842 RepID=UPI002F967599